MSLKKFILQGQAHKFGLLPLLILCTMSDAQANRGEVADALRKALTRGARAATTEAGSLQNFNSFEDALARIDLAESDIMNTARISDRLMEIMSGQRTVGDYTESEAIYREAIEQMRSSFGDLQGILNGTITSHDPMSSRIFSLENFTLGLSVIPSTRNSDEAISFIRETNPSWASELGVTNRLLNPIGVAEASIVPALVDPRNADHIRRLNQIFSRRNLGVHGNESWERAHSYFYSGYQSFSLLGSRFGTTNVDFVAGYLTHTESPVNPMALTVFERASEGRITSFRPQGFAYSYIDDQGVPWQRPVNVGDVVLNEIFVASPGNIQFVLRLTKADLEAGGRALVRKWLASGIAHAPDEMSSRLNELVRLAQSGGNDISEDTFLRTLLEVLDGLDNSSDAAILQVVSKALSGVF